MRSAIATSFGLTLEKTGKNVHVRLGYHHHHFQKEKKKLFKEVIHGYSFFCLHLRRYIETDSFFFSVCRASIASEAVSRNFPEVLISRPQISGASCSVYPRFYVVYYTHTHSRFVYTFLHSLALVCLFMVIFVFLEVRAGLLRLHCFECACLFVIFILYLPKNSAPVLLVWKKKIHAVTES